MAARLDDSMAAEVSNEGDLSAQWQAARTTVLGALDDPARAATVVGGRFGEQPFESVGRLLCADTLVYAWDLARATGQGHWLHPGGVAAAITFLTPLDETIRGPGVFSPKLAPAPDADEQTRLLSFCGRAV